MVPHDKFCVLPWVSLEASPVGTVRPCCLADDELVDDSGEKFSLHTADFGAVQRSQAMRSLRAEFLAGEQPQTCRRCWTEERAGRTSKRMHTLDRLKHSIDSSEWTLDAKPLVFLDLKLGNICNLKCRICGSWSSSQFATEELSSLPRDQQKKSYAYTMLRAGAWPREAETFWAEIDSCLDSIRYIEFTGGEPFLIDQHFDLLQRMIDLGVAHQVEIHYNSNGTVWPERGEQIWPHFRTVEVALSIDDLGPRFEYQRSGAKWSEVLVNLQRFKSLRARSPNLKLQCCSTVNVFNIFYIDELARWVDGAGFDFVYWNVMHDAWYFSVGCLPLHTKKEVSERIDLSLIPTRQRADVEKVLAFMNGGASTDAFMTKMKIRDLDQKRDTDLGQALPLLAASLDYGKA